VSPPPATSSVLGPLPAVIAHRGFGRGESAGPAENTLEAFRAAVDAGVRWVEVDVRRSRDDGLFVLHHPTTPDGTFLVDQGAARIRAAGVLAVEALMDALPAGIGVCFDVKTSLEDATRPPERSTAVLLTPVLREQQRRRPLLVTSFDPAALLLVRRAVPPVPLGLLTWLSYPMRKAVPAAAHLGVQVVGVHWRSFARNDVDPAPVHRPSADSVAVAHAAGLQVAAWCPDVATCRTLLDAGVDGLVVDDVPGALRLVAGRG
jgi:glycerophosphoryl diester phosphodiesterase